MKKKSIQGVECMNLSENASLYYLRITATPNCNLSCVYCNPEREFSAGYMPDNELLDSIRAAYHFGIKTVHFTGGEPTVRPGFVDLVSETRRIGMMTINVTTNGVLFNNMAEKLKNAGLTGVSISLDSLKSERVSSITGYNILGPVKESIMKSCDLFKNVVVNMVVMHQNFEEIEDFVKFARQMKGRFIPRFCELQNYGPIYEKIPTHFIQDLVPRKRIIKALTQLGQLNEKHRNDVDRHNGQAEYYTLGDDNLIVGVIAPYSNGWPCTRANCRRIRIGPKGAIKSCVFSPSYHLNGLSFENKLKVLKKIIAEKDNRQVMGNYPAQHIPAYKSFRFGKQEGK